MSRLATITVRAALLLAFGLMCGLIASEILVRLIGDAPEVAYESTGRYRLSPDPKLVYEPIPNVSAADLSDKYVVTYSGPSNALGYRGPVYPATKTPGDYRILVIGDSIADGYNIERYEDTFPAVMESRLRASGIRAQVMDFGVCGYQTSQEVETLRVRGLVYKPDAVLIAYCLNDQESSNDAGIGQRLLDQSERATNHAARIERAWANPWLRRSALYRFLYYRVLSDGHLSQATRIAYQDTTRNSVAENFALLAQMQHEYGFRVFLAVFPRFSRRLDAYPRQEHEFVENLARHNQFEVIDLVDTFQQCAVVSPDPVAMDTWHPTAKGHRCAGETIAQVIGAALG